MDWKDIEPLYLPNYSDEEMNNAFEYLKNANLGDYKGDAPLTFGSRHVGNICSNQFFAKWRARCKGDGNKGDFLTFANKNGIAFWKKHINQETAASYFTTASLRSNRASQFKPRIASILTSELKATRVLDFSAGWGDRCIGVMAKGADYIGIDSNTDLEEAYEQMSERFDLNPTMFFQPAETMDFTTLPAYDMILTSPPYFTLENYIHMPKYNGYQGWVDTFLKPVVQRAWASLQQNGWMCLNVPSSTSKSSKWGIYESIVEFMGLPHRIYRMNLQNGTTDGDNNEGIYCWHKSDIPAPTTITVPTIKPKPTIKDVESGKVDSNGELREQIKGMLYKVWLSDNTDDLKMLRHMLFKMDDPV